ncbi:MAG: GMC family oxidoreductase N-terminal domain-containing protein [Desulfatirhabdiaceae bacterium]
MGKKKVLIVGSGPGGATVAKEMAQKGHQVAIFEWGKDNSSAPGAFSSPFRFFGGIKNKSNAFLSTDGDPSIEIVRPITLGGATLVYGGVSWDPPFDLFKEKYGIDLKSEVESIKQEIIVKPLDDSQMGPVGQLLKKSAVKLGLKWENIDRFFKAPEKFRQTAYLFGDKTGARWDARMWIKDAVANGAVLYNETYCEKLIIKGGKATGVIAVDPKGRKENYFSDIIIVAAGGIGSPVLLQNSGIAAGKNIFVDPYVMATGYLDRKLMKSEVTRQSGVLIKEEGISLGDASIPSQAYKKLIMANKKIDKFFKRSRSVSILVEIDDDIGGEISATGKIKKSLSENDFQKLEKGKKIAEEILKTAGAKDIWFTRIAGVHPGGGCKIGSVVDENLSTPVKNLYVCDASVLPEAFAIPPVMTILALAKRLASHLEAQMIS